MTPSQYQSSLRPLNGIAESYVSLVLAVGERDPDYVDAYYGPTEWREKAKRDSVQLDAINSRARSVLHELQEIDVTAEEEAIKLRHQYLSKQIQSLIARVEMLGGKSFTFDEEAQALYDAHPPVNTEIFFHDVIRQLGSLLPGNRPVGVRYDEFRRGFVIPVAKLDAVFKAAIGECRERTRRAIGLPPAEQFTLEYVTNKSWSGYNWYKGGGFSLIQINTDLPIYIDRAVDLAAHEGYPGHHVYNSLLEQNLARDRGWVEFTVYALFSPQSLVAEGTANFGIEVAFPGDERTEFERDVLFPLAGLDAGEAEHYYAVHKLTGSLNYAHNEAARGYLDGKLTRQQAEEWLVSFALMSPERAQQRVRFIDTYRSYVINYNLGQDLVRNYINSRGGTSGNPARRWQEFRKLLSSPRLPSGL